MEILGDFTKQVKKLENEMLDESSQRSFKIKIIDKNNFNPGTKVDRSMIL